MAPSTVTGVSDSFSAGQDQQQQTDSTFTDLSLQQEKSTTELVDDNNDNNNTINSNNDNEMHEQSDTAGSKSTTQSTPPTPTTTTDVDNPSHPLYRHRRTVADFVYGPILGEGSYSTVLVGEDKKTGKYYAVKKLDKAHIVKNDKVKYVMIERDALSKMNHPGIVRLYWTFKDNRSLYYVLDLARNGELYTYIRRLAPFDMDTARFYAAEILLAIEHIHSRGVIHRDIKPENILLNDNLHIKITDFGSAKIISPDNASKKSDENNAGRSRSFVGTAEYVSPELLRSEPTLQEADLWALGCVIYQMHAGRSPFKAATDYLIFQRIKNRDLNFPEGFPAVAQDIVEKLLVLEPSERLGSEATGGMDALKQHPYFEGVDWENIWDSPAPPLKERLDAKLKKIRQAQNSESVDNNNEFDLWFGGDEEQQHQYHQQIEQIQKEQQGQQEQREGIIIPGIPTIEGGRQEPSSSSSATTVPAVPTVLSVPPSPKTPTDPFGDHAATKNQIYEDDESDDDDISRYNNKYGSTSVRGPAAAAVRRYPSGTTSIRSGDIVSTSSTGRRRGHTRNSSSYSSSNTQSLERLGEQSHPPWIAHLYPNESIIRASRLLRKRGLFSKKRFLMLTDRPRLLYLDEGPAQDGSGGTLRCEIGWNPELLPELKTKSVFCIHTPQKLYTFEDPKGHAQDWVNTINSMLVDSFGVTA
ncbi:kinase-like domain-containing protein [Circinella umbellata]|nr:kinase-like domain-containing protein [Circinella umbellata]